MRVGFDIDDVLYDWTASVHHHINTSRSDLVALINEKIGPDFDREWKTWTHYKSWGLTSEQFVALCDEATNEGEMFRRGEPARGAKEAIDRIRDAGHTIVFITARNFGSPGEAERRTIQWLTTYRLADFSVDELHMTEDKTGFDLDWMIEDSVDQARAIDGNPPGYTSVVLMDHPWNHHAMDEFDRVYSVDEYADLVLVLDEVYWPPMPVISEEAQEAQNKWLADLAEVTHHPAHFIQYDAQRDAPELEALLAEEVEIENDFSQGVTDTFPQILHVEGFVTKDSGQREQFGSGAVRDTQEGKPRYDLIPPGPLKRHAELMARGAIKYGDSNWTKGMPVSRILASAQRHLEQYRAGDRTEDHLAAVAFNVYAGMFFEDTEWDDTGDLPW